MLSDTLFHLTVKCGQRSKGRSAIAKAAYDSASVLHDQRQGRTFDYSRKSAVVQSFILAPKDAPVWTQDREQLWNRVEKAERRRDAVLWREIEVSIPRDMPPNAWKKFITDACQAYIVVGAICDVSIHNPSAADGGEQPHAHIMIGPRALDNCTPSGFSSSKNQQLATMFESGGRHGGERGAALQAERARWANMMNIFLQDHGSGLRADHRSLADRGIDRQPESKIGEWRMHAFKKRQRARDPTHDRRLRHVAAIRQLRNAEKVLLRTELEIEMKSPKFPFKRQKQDVKNELLRQRIPNVDLSSLPDDAIYRVDVSNNVLSVMMRDDSFLELEGNQIIYYGGPGKESQAEQLARSIERAGYADGVEYMPLSVKISRGRLHSHQNSVRYGNSDDVPDTWQARIGEDEIQSLAEKWRGRGFARVRESRSGVWVHLDRRTRLHDTGDTISLHGLVTDDAIRAMVLNARENWDGLCEISGDDNFKSRIWLEAQRQGVRITNYEPSEDARKRWEQERSNKTTLNLTSASIVDDIKTADILHRAANGSSDAMWRLSPELRAFLYGYAYEDKHAVSALRTARPVDIVPELARFQYYGRAYIEPEKVHAELKAWLENESKALPPQCPHIAILAQQQLAKGLGAEEVSIRLAKALRVTDEAGHLMTSAEVKRIVQEHWNDEMREAIAEEKPERKYDL